MKIVRNLRQLELNAKWAISRSGRLLSNTTAPANTFAKEERITFATVNLLNSWANFQRSYFICCLLGTKSIGLKKIYSNQTGLITTPNDAIGKAVNHFSPTKSPRSNGLWDTRDEPTWHDSNTLLKLSDVYAFSNNSDIKTSFTFGFTAHKNLVVFRNYYAHKNQGTRKKAQAIAVQYLIPQRFHPTDILLATPSTSISTNLLQLWVEELNQTVELLCS